MEAGSRREDVGEGEESLKSGSKGSITQESDHTPDLHHSASKIARQPSLPVDPTQQLTPFPATRDVEQHRGKSACVTTKGWSSIILSCMYIHPLLYISMYIYSS